MISFVFADDLLAALALLVAYGPEDTSLTVSVILSDSAGVESSELSTSGAGGAGGGLVDERS